MKIGNEIKKIRKECLLSQEEFAATIGVAFSTVNRWEKEKAIPNMKSLKAIRQFCSDNSKPFTLTECILGEE